MYADDTTIIVKNKEKDTLETLVHDAMSKVISWLETNNLSRNIQKTKLI